MKKLILVALLIVSAITVGQEKKEKQNIKKGTWVFGGDLNFSSGGNDYTDPSISDTDYTGFGITAKTGYVFTKNNLELGLGLGFSTSKNASGDYENKTNSYKIAPYVKKYLPVNDIFSFFLQGEVAFSNYNIEENYNNSTDIESNSLFIGVRPGFVYFVTKKLALNANIGALGYNTNTYKTDNVTQSKNNSFSFNLSSSDLLFGFCYFL
ncbi:Outer membrane protein beta-barrel domain-containing protein [Polaribacter sp. KT25b]|uniref:outer membrane beta-barrel protein n=1 Tax=Polaribacter sp. KT25b TaxID=1855336 RepID=UPI00087A6586|nr:outer membrane beta-barrel protein [Polaribacter sp. KT25b]SDR74624.1 Outer membrane protein beta-barrel domain-containing protein [Polaribacter sp. KT25b]